MDIANVTGGKYLIWIWTPVSSGQCESTHTETQTHTQYTHSDDRSLSHTHGRIRRPENFEIQKFEPHETDKANSKPRSELATEQIDYKNIKLLNRYTSRYGKIVAKHYTKVTLKQQKKLAQEIKRSRHVALMPFVK